MAIGIKTGGRSKGTPNKTQAQIREHFQKLIEDNLPELSKDLKSLSPEQRLHLVIALAKFVVPTLKAVDLTSAGGKLLIEMNVPPVPDIGNRSFMPDIGNRPPKL